MKENLKTLHFTEKLQLLRKNVATDADITIREFKIGQTDVNVAIVYVNGLIDKELINENVLKSLMVNFFEVYKFEISLATSDEIKMFLKNYVLTIGSLKECDIVDEMYTELLTGYTVLLIDGMKGVLLLETKLWKVRGIEEPITENLVRGPRIGFTESLGDNMSLLRRQSGKAHVTIDQFSVGNRTKKNVVIAYFKDIANDELVNEVRNRICSINIDDVAESGYIEQLIEDNYLSPFPQIQSTERPDRVMGALLEGRVSILLDGTPFALIVPTGFSMLLQSPEDYYERWIPASLLRSLRYMAAFISLFLPAIYISFVSFHQGLIPTKLVMSMAGTRMGVPFPSFIEALLMEVSIEILREAGLRLPKPVGQTVGLVGGLVVGEAAVQANIVSPIMVIVVALTAISSFVIPQYGASVALRMLRFVTMFFAAILGLYGVILFVLLLTTHLIKLKSFNMLYVTPAVPYRFSDLKDFIVRMPLRFMKVRPKMLHPKDSIRKRDKR
ncbi:spore germination protein [Bacillus thuringiensis]|nr:spore germination protein [Bacillus thuringiensis]